MFFQGEKSSSMDSAVAEPLSPLFSSQTAHQSEGKSAASSKSLLCRAMVRFHCALKTYLSLNTVLGRSLANLETVVKVQREFMLYVLLVLMMLSFLIGVFGRSMSNLVCVPYPAVVSWISIDSNVNQRLLKWITYWTIYGCVTLVDTLCPLVCEMVPQFHLWRTVFLVWCFCPYKCNGSRIIRDALFTSKNMRILRIGADVVYEAFRAVTVH